MVDGLRVDVFAKLTDTCQSRLFLKLLLPASFFGGSYGDNFCHQLHHLTLSLCGCMLGCCCIVHKLSASWCHCLIYAIYGWLLCKINVADVGSLRMDVFLKLTDAS
jgi:hypothetical protein